CVMIDARGTPLEQRGDDHGPRAFCKFAEPLCRRAGNGLRPFEILVVFHLAKILRAKEFLSANDAGALLHRPLRCLESPADVGFEVRRTGGLDEADLDRGLRPGGLHAAQLCTKIRSVVPTTCVSPLEESVPAFWPNNSRIYRPSVSFVGP